jgi:hypothetical protein
MKELEDINSKSVILLMKETGLAATSIEQGLTVLRKANFSQKWLYYQAFFQLSIGIERLLKLIFIVKNLVEKDAFPDNNELKKYSHDIKNMFIKISLELKPNDVFLDENELYPQILTFLSTFASNSRYYNLDTLSGISKSNDPLHDWHIIQKQIKLKYCKPKDFTDFEKHLINSINEFSSFMYRDESDNPINDSYSYFEEGKYLDKTQGYSVLLIYRIIDYLVFLLLDCASKKRMLPFYKDFFPLFQNIGMKELDIRKRKNWNFLTKPR